MYTLEPAREADIPRCGEILDEGRAFQQAQGFVQWTEDYPNAGTVRQDIRDRKGYVIRSGGDIAAYLCIDFGGEPAYKEIRGAWQTEEPYAVVHRMAFAPEFRGPGADRDRLPPGGSPLPGAGRPEPPGGHRPFQPADAARAGEKRLCPSGDHLLPGRERLAYDKSL